VKSNDSGSTAIADISSISEEEADDSFGEEANKQSDNEKFETALLEYKEYLATLNKDSIEAILYGLEKYKKYSSAEKSNNDKLFDLFDDFYNECIYNRLGLLDKYLSLTDKELKKYGLIHWENMIIPDDSFKYNTFIKYLTKGKVEFLRLSYKENKNNYFRDCTFSSNLDAYSDSIIAWENYSRLYGSCPEYKKEAAFARETAADRVKDLINHNNDLDIPVFQALFEPNDTLSPEAQKSYLSFAEKYSDSAFKKVILDYYNILKSNNFEYNKEAEEYLKSKDLFIDKSEINGKIADSE
jgi:hypothetical protein